MYLMNNKNNFYVQNHECQEFFFRIYYNLKININ